LTVTIDGLSVNYERSGPEITADTPVIFILHGWGANLEIYRSIEQTVSAKYPTVLFDFPGFGKSEEPKEPWDVSRYTAFTVKFIQSFHCQRVILIGHSFGGRVIIKMLTEHKDLCDFTVDKIVLTDSAGVRPKRSFKAKCRTRVYKTAKWFVKLPPVKKLKPDALDKLQKKFGSADYAAASPMMRQCMVRVVNEDLRHLFPQIPVSALLVWGDRDTATPLSDGQMMEKMMPDAGLVTLQNAGHFSFLDQPRVYQAVLRSFLKIGA